MEIQTFKLSCIQMNSKMSTNVHLTVKTDDAAIVVKLKEVNY